MRYSQDYAFTGYLWPIVREMMKTAIENKQNLIVEGCYLPFNWRKDFDKRYLPSIRFVCLAMTIVACLVLGLYVLF